MKRENGLKSAIRDAFREKFKNSTFLKPLILLIEMRLAHRLETNH